jgi:predicted small secreted protein
MVRKILLILALLVMVVSLVGCQTVQGVGRDITWTGEAGAEVVDGALN